MTKLIIHHYFIIHHKNYFKNINRAEYQLQQQLLPLICQRRQDSAPGRHACATVECLHQVMLEVISPDLLPANSPGLNPVDYKVWGCLQD